ncbi:MAG: DNA replication/repair protein RecF [Oscillospiraceae bacterium]|jgi:DNA replication and repair protein RecF|nr:DNA replication/repair protein RecF [Oscillospiraceae bacterium]
MIYKKAKFKNYRNLKEEKLEFCKNTNIFYGQNAQGKTNLLEMLYLFSGNRSFRGAKDQEQALFESDGYVAELEFFAEEREQTAKIVFNKKDKQKKQIEINGVKKNSRLFLMEKIKAVIFSPEHLALIKEGPASRRKFLCSALCSLKVKNANVLYRHNKILNQRNALLKDICKHPDLKETLSIWDESLITCGSTLTHEAFKFTQKLNQKANEYHKGISGGAEELTVEYISSVGAKSDDTTEQIKEKYKKTLEKNQRSDIYMGATTAGFQRDDIEIKINGKSVKAYGSQGQQRSAVISLKLAEAAIIEETFGEKPVILLDDVLSELDFDRRRFLTEKIKDFQVFITLCEGLEENSDTDAFIFDVADGNVKRR